jgi:hypothetical protein
MWNKYCAKPGWDEEEMDGWNWSSSVTLHKIIQNSSIFGQKKITSVLDCSQPSDVLCTYYELTPLTCVLQFCNMGKEQNLEVEMLDAVRAWKTLPAGSRNPNETS